MPKKTVDNCVGKGFSYLLKVKANQPKLHNEILKKENYGRLLDFAHSNEVQKGREERREVQVYEFPEEVINDWKMAKTCLVVIRSGIREGEPYEGRCYYISNLVETAADFLQFVRMHWEVENELHRNKLLSPGLSGDVNYKEDYSSICKKNGAGNFSLLRGFALGELYKNDNKEIKGLMQVENPAP